MTYYNFVLLLRILKRRWVLTSFNFIVYGIGLAVCLIIGQKMSYELSYDKANKNYKNIYRITVDHYYPHDVFQNSTATSFYPMGPELVTRYPEIENMTRILNEDMERTAIIYEGQIYSSSNIFVIDTTFFQLFDLEIKYGDAKKLRYKDIFISESLSNKIFGSDEPIGKTIEMFNNQFKVKGVFKDVGSNAHIKFNLLMVDRERTYREAYWGGYNHYTYLLLKENADVDELRKKLKDFSSEFSKISDKVSQVEYRWEMDLQPIADIHLKSHLEFEREANGDMQDIYLMVAIIVMLMIISCFNYTNLLMLINEERLKEFHIRKIFGASRFQLLKQTLGESLLFAMVAVPFAGLIIRMVFFLGWSGFGIEFSEGRNYIILIGILVTFVMIHLLFPAFLVVKSIALRFLDVNRSVSKNPGSGKRLFLAVPQLAISVVLIAMAITVNKQLKFLGELDLGFSNDNVLTLSTQLPTGYANAGMRNLENSLKQRPQVKAVAFSETIPGERFERDGSFKFAGQAEEDSKFCYLQMISPSYFEAFQIDVLAGRSFSPDRSVDSLSVVVNESLAKLLNVPYEDLIGRDASIPFEEQYRTFKIIGVVKDYYQQSLRNKIEPCAYLNVEKFPAIISSISVRTELLHDQGKRDLVDQLKASFKSSFPNDLANFSYAKDLYKSQFSKDYQFSRVINTITLISVIMTILGFVGLASNYIRKRTKEVAIRKVNGASVTDIYLLFGLSYLKVIAITLFIAFPLSFYLVKIWLEHFVVSVDLGAWFIVWPVIITIGVFLSSITYYVAKSALLNPVKILKEN